MKTDCPHPDGRIIALIDPGVSGGIAIIRVDYKQEYLLSVIHQIVTPVKIANKGKGGLKAVREIDSRFIKNYFRKYRIEFVYIEYAKAMSTAARGGEVGGKQGAVSAFNSGANWGRYRGLLEGLGVPYELVSPAKWSRYFISREDKEKYGKKRASIAVANRLFPGVDIIRAGHDGIAEALLIGAYMLQGGDSRE